MTSKISFSSLVRSERKKMNWLLAVQALLFGLIMPFRVLIVLAVAALEKNKYAYDIDFSQIFRANAGFGQTENTVLIVAAGILCALAAFSYLHSSVKLDFYHSLPIKRSSLFAVKLLASLLTFAVPYMICQALTLLVGIAYGAAGGAAAAEIIVDTIYGLLYFLCSYAGTLLAVMLTGRMVTTFFAMLALTGYLPLLYVLYMGMRALFLTNALDYVETVSEKLLYYSSPWIFCLCADPISSHTTDGMTGFWPDLSTFCQLTAMTVFLLLICVWLYQKRRTEAAGNALAFKKTEGLVKILLTVAAALAAAMAAHGILESRFWELAFIILFGALACVIMEFIYRADIRQALAHKSHIVVTIVAAAGIFFFGEYDVAGYNSYVPDKSEVQAMAMADNMLQIQYDTGNGYPRFYMTRLTTDLLDYLETEKFDSLYEVAAEGAACQGGYYEDVCRVGVKYHLKNGKEIYRSYQVNEEQYLDAMDEAMEDLTLKEKYFPIMTWDREMAEAQVANIWLPDDMLDSLIEEGSVEVWGITVGGDTATEELYQIISENLTGDRLWQVVQAYRKDLEELSYRDIFYTSGELSFQWSERGQCYYGNYPLDLGFTHTIETLKEVLGS